MSKDGIPGATQDDSRSREIVPVAEGSELVVPVFVQFGQVSRVDVGVFAVVLLGSMLMGVDGFVLPMPVLVQVLMVVFVAMPVIVLVTMHLPFMRMFVIVNVGVIVSVKMLVFMRALQEYQPLR